MPNSFRQLIIISALIFNTTSVYALNFDTSIDAEIKQKYNSTKLEDEVLPNLPKVPASSKPAYTNKTVPQNLPTYTEQPPVITKINKKDAIKLPNRTKFQVKSNSQISDWLTEGTYVSFTTTSPVFKKYITIPSGTKLTGIVKDSHRPQSTGNGGLVELKITSITYNGKSYTVDGKITKANHKKIFFNNIKGKRQYIKGVAKQINKGENFYNKTRNISSKMSKNPIGAILSPIPTIVGITGYSVCTILSPITGLGNKGGNISIPAGSQFEIKLIDEAYIY